VISERVVCAVYEASRINAARLESARVRPTGSVAIRERERESRLQRCFTSNHIHSVREAPELDCVRVRRRLLAQTNNDRTTRRDETRRTNERTNASTLIDDLFCPVPSVSAFVSLRLISPDLSRTGVERGPEAHRPPMFSGNKWSK